MSKLHDTKVPYEQGPEGTGTLLTGLITQHMESVRYYRAAAEALEGQSEKGTAYFRDLANYRQNAFDKLSRVVSDIGAGVNTPSQGNFSYLKDHEERFNKALTSHNTVELAELAYENEQATSTAYRHALDNENLLDFAEEILHEQHEDILRWVNRADRYKTVPQTEIDHEAKELDGTLPTPD